MALSVVQNSLFAGTTQGIFKTTDNGASWSPVLNGLTTHYTLSLLSSGTNLFAGTWGGGVFLSSDSGENWHSINSGLTNMDDRALTIFNDDLYLAAVGGVWKRPLQEVIPVELSSFTAEAIDGSVLLEWQTATETNNRGFEVQRLQSGESPQWSVIGFVKGNGTTTSKSTYTFKDKPVASGKYSYRLRQIDFDGSFEYSGIVEAEINTSLKFELSQNYPNPFNPTTMIKYSVPREGMVKLDVYNALGQKTAELVNGVVKAGSYEVNFTANNLSTGVYYYRIETDGFVSTKKMIILK